MFLSNNSTKADRKITCFFPGNNNNGLLFLFFLVFNVSMKNVSFQDPLRMMFSLFVYMRKPEVLKWLWVIAIPDTLKLKKDVYPRKNKPKLDTSDAFAHHRAPRATNTAFDQCRVRKILVHSGGVK